MERINLSAHHDITNVVGPKDLRRVIRETLDTFIEQLSIICGPYSRQALVLPNGEVGINTNTISTKNDVRCFMRDGAHILNATECVSPIQQYLKSIVHYVGSRVDDVCKDGTTTSMLMTCALISQLVSKHEELDRYPLVKINEKFRELVATFKKIMKDEHTITVEDIAKDFGISKNEAAHFVAFTQVYTATGGDLEIAKTVADFFKRTPEEVWGGTITWNCPSVEVSDYRCKAEPRDYEYKLKSIHLTSQHNNVNLRMFYENNHVDVLPLYMGVCDVAPETEDFYRYLTKRIEEDKNTTPLLILVPALENYMPGRVIETINNISSTSKVPILIVTHNTVDNRSGAPWYTIALAGKANVEVYHGLGSDIENCVIRDVSVRITHRNIEFTNLVPKDSRMSEDDLRHPGLVYPDDYPHHRKALDIIDEDRKRVADAHREIYEEREAVENCYNELLVRTTMTVNLGGTTHDQREMMTVIEDATGSARTAVMYGIVTNAMFRTCNVWQKIVQQCHGVDKLGEILASCVCDAAHQVCLALFRDHAESAGHAAAVLGTLEEHTGGSIDKYTYVDIVNFMETETAKAFTFRGDNPDWMEQLVRGDILSYPPVQTAEMTNELFTRLNEVALRTGLMAMVVVPGGAWAPDGGDK